MMHDARPHLHSDHGAPPHPGLILIDTGPYRNENRSICNLSQNRPRGTAVGHIRPINLSFEISLHGHSEDPGQGHVVYRLALL